MKSNKQKNTKVTATYEERSVRQSGKAINKLMDGGIKDFESALKDFDNSSKLMRSGCRKIYTAGRKFSEARELNQLQFKGWHSDIAGWKEEYIRREKVTACNRIYNKMGPDWNPQKLDECKPIIQECLALSGQLSHAKRLPETIHAESNPFNGIVTGLNSVFASLEEVTKARPLNEWATDELDSFVHSAKPIAEKLNAVEQELNRRRSN